MLHFYPPHHNAGAEWAVHPMLRALAQRGHTVDVLLSRDHPAIVEPYTFDGVPVHPHRGKGDPFEWLLDDERRPDVLLAHLENTPRAMILGRTYGVPVVNVLHNDRDISLAWCTPDTALVVANSRWLAEQLDHPNTVVVPPPVFADEYATTPGDAVTLVNLCERKGASVFYALAERFPNTRFLGVRGAYGEQLVRDDLPNVEIVEHVPGDQMRDQVYARTRVLLMPSAYESYGRCAVEAMCSGIPVIASPTAGLREAVDDGGALIDPADIDAWARTLRRLLTPRGWSAASKRAKARAARLDPAGDLDRFCAAVEALRRGGD